MQARVHVFLVCFVGMLAGIAAASAIAPDKVGALAGLGLSLTVLVLSVGAVEGLQRLPKSLSIAPRILGAWTVAICLLLSALAVSAIQERPIL